MSLICVAEEEVCFYFCQRAPLGHRDVADLEENEDRKLVLKGDRVQGAGAALGIWLAALTVKIQRGFVVFGQHLKESIGDRHVF